MRQRDERQDRGQGGEDHRAGTLHGGFHHGAEGVQSGVFVFADLPDQDERVAHQNAGQGDQANQRIDAKGLLKQQQCRHHSDQAQRAGQEDHDHP
ncbi:hypothetical protein D3C72_2090690 [compost metagenome]